MLQERILYILEQNRDRVVTGGGMSKQLGVSRTAVWKTVAALREGGHDIASVPNSGYRLSGDSDGLTAQVIGDLLTTRRLGKSLELLKTVDSTNRYLRSRDTEALPEGHTVIADEQTGGRGRLGRTFFSPARGGIYLSCLLKPPVPLADTPFLTICAAVAVCRAVREVCGMQAEIKWINDIYHGGKKLCGILTEASVSAEIQSVDYAVVGIGVNTGEVDARVRDIATSVYEATGLRGIRNRLAAEILNQFERVYLDYTIRGEKQEIISEYTGRLFIIGRRIQVDGYGGGYEATALGVDDSGRLMVKRADGVTTSVESGEISLIKEA